MRSTSSSARAVLFVVLIAAWLRGALLAQTPQTPSPAAAASELKLDTGKEIFEAACIGCHGPGGRGQPQTTLGFEPPATFPDFSDCNGSTRERIADWRATIHEGGPGRGFSDIMPSFAEALTLEQIDRVTSYLRTLCTEPAWPLGELNLPRALLTEKAFPEDETVVTMAANANGAGALFERPHLRETIRRPQSARNRGAPQLLGAGRGRLGRRRRRPRRRLQARRGPQRPDRIDLQRRGRGERADRQQRQRARPGRDEVRNVCGVRPDPAAFQLSPGSERRGVPDRHREGAEGRLRANGVREDLQPESRVRPKLDADGRAHRRPGVRNRRHHELGCRCAKCRSRSTNGSTFA